MCVVSLLIGKASNRMFWQALEHALGADPTLTVYEESTGASIGRILRRRRPQVLIVDMPVGGTDVEYRRYIKKYPELTIICIDLCVDRKKRAHLVLHAGDIGFVLLLQLIRTLIGQHAETAEQGDPPRLHLIGPGNVHDHDAQDGSQDVIEEMSSLVGEPPPQYMNDMLRWLDLCLHQRLAREVDSDDGASTPAWAMNAVRARGLLSPEFSRTPESQLRMARKEMEAAVFTPAGAPSPFLDVCDAFRLAHDERQILLMGLAPELDGRYARIFGFLNDDLTRRRPSATVLAQLLMAGDAPAWSLRKKLTDDHALGFYRLLALDPYDRLPGSEAAIVPASEIAAFLLAFPAKAPDYASFVSVIPPHGTDRSDARATGGLREELLRWTEGASRGALQVPIVQLAGDGATRRWFERAVLDTGETIAVFNLAALEEQNIGRLQDSCLVAARIAVLHGSILLVVGRECLTPELREWFDATLLLELHRRVPRMAVCGEASWVIRTSASVWPVDRARLQTVGRAAIWQERAESLGVQVSAEDARLIASTVQFDEAQIDATLRSCGSHAVERWQLQAAARRIARTAVPSTVRRIDAAYSWDDIVLPAPIKDQLSQIRGHVHHAEKVLDEWGFRKRMPYGSGVAALFSGPSGTGKTMTAQIIAGELGVELFQVDLAQTVSKYIGETEKNLSAVFDAAEKASAVLLFDEADALFGKRTEVRDAHDRYANVEVAYLLQRMESYCGLAILTTNMRRNMDSAFLRRLRFIVEFPQPTAGDRKLIWKRVFPQHSRLAEDVDLAFLARQLKLTGGHIQQIAIRAAFAAAADGDVIAMRHIVDATREELRKLGMFNAEKSLAAVAA